MWAKENELNMRPQKYLQGFTREKKSKREQGSHTAWLTAVPGHGWQKGEELITKQELRSL